jgi:hypothetical protein
VEKPLTMNEIIENARINSEAIKRIVINYIQNLR